MLVVPFGRREMLGVVVGLRGSQRGRRGAPARAAARARAGCPARAGRAGRLDRRGVLLDDRAGARPGAAARRDAHVSAGAKRRAVPRPEHLAVGSRSPQAPQLTGEQEAVLAPLVAALRTRSAERQAAARRDRLGQDRDLPARRRRGARAGPRRDRARARDRADAADRRALHRALRRHRRGAALAPAPGGSATRSGGACARARRASASARARRCSRRSQTSA